MKLHHLGLWMLAMPVFAAQLPSQTTGTLYVHARLVTPPCQPNITVQRGVNHVNDPIYQFSVSFAHCANARQVQQRLPFSLKLGNETLLLSKTLSNNTMLFSVPASHSARRLEINYD